MEWRCRVGMFTRSKDLGECHLVFTAFLTSAWRGGGGGGGMKVEVGGGGESGREKDVMTPTTTTTTSEAQSGCDRGAGRSLVSSVCCKHEPAGSG